MQEITDCVGQLAAQLLAFGAADVGDVTAEATVTGSVPCLIMPPHRPMGAGVRQVADVVVGSTTG